MVRVRVAALVVRGKRVLLAKHVKDSRVSYLLPGGGLEAHETAREALLRELREEAGITRCALGDLRYVIEARSPNGSKHLVQLVFEGEVHGDIGPSTDPRVAECAWHDADELRTLNVHPSIGAMLADDIRSGARHGCRYVEAPWIL